MKIILLLIPLVLLLLPVLIPAQETLQVDLFYLQGCSHCTKVIGYLEDYQLENPGLIEIIMHDASAESDLFISIQREVDVPIEAWGAVPKVFVGDYYCIGSDQCHEELLQKLDDIVSGVNETADNTTDDDTDEENTEVNTYQILGLAAVDAVNPCALAVLTLILVSILVQNPDKRRRVLTAGLSFTLAIFITYFFYGLLIVHLFKTALANISGVNLYLYTILGLAAIILGILNIKDYFSYKPGGIATEMPMRMRPAVKRVISKATSSGGAFIIGIIVTLFLLPCTIGPYVITGGILSGLDFMSVIPWLLIYNLIFILPMFLIVLVVYIGFTTVENVSGWKDKNIRYLHLVAGIIIILLGISMVMGWV
ncbi:MAG: hypothetical protein ABIH52_02025 [Candidatus Aenigmatarchaeota archaeon]